MSLFSILKKSLPSRYPKSGCGVNDLVAFTDLKKTIHEMSVAQTTWTQVTRQCFTNGSFYFWRVNIHFLPIDRLRPKLSYAYEATAP